MRFGDLGSMTDPVVTAASPQLWGDVCAVFAGRGDPARCWCQWFRMVNADWRTTTAAGNRAGLERQVEASGGAGPPPGVLAYVDGRPVGWCAVAPRPAYARLTVSTAVRDTTAEPDLADHGVWAIPCLVVRPDSRRRGVTAALVAGALDVARAHGARVVEAYPVDVTVKERVSASELYHGALSTFLRAGFEEGERSSAARPVVRLVMAITR